jgi:acetyl-CoA carboxylase carboxyltransferase component
MRQTVTPDMLSASCSWSSLASRLEIDDVIDPAENRAWLARGLRCAAGAPLPPRRPMLDTW